MGRCRGLGGGTRAAAVDEPGGRRADGGPARGLERRGIQRAHRATPEQPARLDAHTLGRERRDAVKEGHETGTARHVSRHRKVRAIAEDRADEAREHAARAGLDEHAGAGFVHRLDLAHEVDRAHQVLAEQLRDGRGVGGVGRRGGVGVDRDPRRRDRRGGELRGQPLLGRAHERGVERTRDREPPRLQPVLGAPGQRSLDGRLGAGHDRLLRRVEVGEDHVLRGHQRRQRVGAGLHGRHRAALLGGALADEAPAGLRQLEQLVLAEPAGRGESHELAVGVARDHVGAHAQRAQQVQVAEVRGPERRLGHVRLGQLRPARALVLGREARRRIHVPVQRLREPAGEDAVRALEALPDLGERDGEVACHVDGLRALAGEQQRDRAVAAERAVREVDPVRVLPRGVSREQLRGRLQLRAQVRERGGDDGQRRRPARRPASAPPARRPGRRAPAPRPPRARRRWRRRRRPRRRATPRGTGTAPPAMGRRPPRAPAGRRRCTPRAPHGSSSRRSRTR